MVDPSGSKLGMLTSIGAAVTNYPADLKTAHSQRWSMSVQRQFATKWFVEATYTGNHGYDLPVNSNYLDAIPAQFLSTSPLRDTATIAALGAAVTNPFYGITPGTSYNTAKTVAISQLLRSIPAVHGNFHDGPDRGQPL